MNTQDRVRRNYGTNGDTGTIVAVDGELVMVMWDHTIEDGQPNTAGRAYWHPTSSLETVTGCAVCRDHCTDEYRTPSGRMIGDYCAQHAPIAWDEQTHSPVFPS